MADRDGGIGPLRSVGLRQHLPDPPFAVAADHPVDAKSLADPIADHDISGPISALCGHLDMARTLQRFSHAGAANGDPQRTVRGEPRRGFGQ